MSKQLHHGTAKSYVIGFILSLLFTLIPYFLVVNNSLTGNVLLAAILGFAFIQLVIQVVFFLHLGREPNPRFQTYFLIATIGAVLVVVGGSIIITTNLHNNMAPSAVKQKLVDDEAIAQVGGVKTGSCQVNLEKHTVTIRDGVAYPSHTTAKQCDTLTITNEDEAVRDITFGVYPEHDSYAGREGRTLYGGKSWTVTLSQEGSYQFHDHAHAETTGYFSVAP